MTKEQIEQLIGKFGMIKTSGEFAKTICGTIKETDVLCNIWFIDNDDIGYLFRLKDIVSFKEIEFNEQ